MTDMAIGEKYAPLGNWLKEHGGDSVKLTFNELNQIIPIPNHAYKNRPSWANLSNPASFCSSWISAGYVVDSISLEEQWVVFRKGEVQGHTHHSKPPYRVVDQKKLAEAIHAGYECYDSMKDDPHHRYLSWEYCHEAFRLNRRPQIDATIDYLCLHLAWYLASWGIVIDECHRGSAKEDSRWRRILEYFHSATQIGMTATPKETKEVSNISYFGEPIYTYSLKQGIDDGFLAPYKVLRVGLDKDLEGWRPTAGQRDIYGYEIDDREYNTKDYDKNLIIDERTNAVAKRITRFLKENDRFAKTIVFCVDIDHAERMRQALVNENSDLVAENAKYVMRITGDNAEGKAQLDYFIAEDSKYPVIVTTSKLMTTGVDCKTCRLIVLDNNINSMTEFKQIIGRGTRLKPDYGKEYFTIMDFRNACRLFADPEFDGDPISIIDDDDDPGEEPTIDPPKPPAPTPGPCGDTDDPPEKKHKYRVRGVEVTILNERVQYYDKDGKLITESVTDYSKKNILGEYATLDSFLRAWNSEEKKQAIIDELQERGVLLEALREASGNKDIDDFDLICHIAYDKAPLTKAERANNVRKRGYLYKYSGLAQEVLSALLDKYMNEGIQDIENLEILSNDPFRKFGTPMKIAKLFGGKNGYIQAIRDLQKEIYAA